MSEFGVVLSCFCLSLSSACTVCCMSAYCLLKQSVCCRQKKCFLRVLFCAAGLWMTLTAVPLKSEDLRAFENMPFSCCGHQKHLLPSLGSHEKRLTLSLFEVVLSEYLYCDGSSFVTVHLCVCVCVLFTNVV